MGAETVDLARFFLFAPHWGVHLFVLLCFEIVGRHESDLLQVS